MDKNLEYEPVRGAHILMIVNPVSGRISGEHVADKLEAWLKENGAAVDRFETTEPENGSGYTAKLAENDYARVVVLGGDGTLNAVLNGMLHRALRTPITYLPAGTTNDFAQTLGIQKHLLDPYKKTASLMPANSATAIFPMSRRSAYLQSAPTPRRAS